LNQHPCTRSSSCCPRCLQSPALWTQYPLGCSSASQLLFVQYYGTYGILWNTVQPVISARHFSQSTEACSSDTTSQKARIGPRHCASCYRPITNLSSPNSSNILSPSASRAMSTYTLCFQPNNPPTDRSTLQRQRSSASTTI